MHKKLSIVLIFCCIGTSNAWGQIFKKLNLDFMCGCYTNKDKAIILKDIQDSKYQSIHSLTISECINDIDTFEGNLSWSKEELDSIYSAIKTIKEISLLRIGFRVDDTPTEGDTIFLRLLECLPPAQYAELFLGGEITKSNTNAVWNFLKQTPLIFDVRQKATIRRYFNITEELAWNGKSGITFPMLDTLVVENFASPYLHASFGYGMDSLEVLMFTYNGDRTLIEGTNSFVGFPKSIGHLSRLKKLYFNGHIGLSMLYMPSSFGNLRNLEKLIVSQAMIDFPNSVFKLKKLKKLVLRNCNPNFFRLKELDSVIVSYKNPNIRPSFRALKKLKYLRLSNINKFPKGFKHLTSLKRLGITSNQNHPLCIPKDIVLSNLEDLSLSLVKKLPSNFGQLKNLQKLNLSYISPLKLPDSFGQLSSLQHLSLGAKNLKELPHDFLKLPSIKSIFVGVGAIKTWPSFTVSLDSLSSLHIVSMSTSLPDGFENLPNLKLLTLASYAPFLPNKIILLGKLKMLNLNMPHLMNLPDSLDNLRNLNTFYILSDSIEQLPKHWKFPNLKKVSFYTYKINTFPLFLFNTLKLEKLVMGYTIKDLEKCCQLKLGNTVGNYFEFYGDYTLSDIPSCFKGKRSIYNISLWKKSYDSNIPNKSFRSFNMGNIYRKPRGTLNY